MDFGVSSPIDWRDAAEQMRLADTPGFSAALFAEHRFSKHGPSP